MARDQFQRIRPGDQLPGLPSQPWNAMMDVLKGRGIGARGPGEGRESAVEVLVLNTTASPVQQFGILRVNAPLSTHAQDEHQFFERDALRGIAPAADAPFVILQEPCSPNSAAWARILGLSRAQVLINDAGDEFAGPGTSTEYLESGASGPVQIIWVDPDCSGSGGWGSGSGAGTVCWATVLIGGSASGGSRVEPGQPRVDATPTPGGEFEWFDRLQVNFSDSPVAATPVEAVLHIDLNTLP